MLTAEVLARTPSGTHPSGESRVGTALEGSARAAPVLRSGVIYCVSEPAVTAVAAVAAVIVVIAAADSDGLL